MKREGLMPQKKKVKKYVPKPYEQMTHPGERIQIDVKVVPRKCIADPELRLYQYTAIDEYSRYRVLGAYPEQSTFSSTDFLRKVVLEFTRKGIEVDVFKVVREKCLQMWPNEEEKKDVTFEYHYSFVVYGCVGVFRTWLNSKCQEPAEKMADMADAMIRRGSLSIA